MYCCEEEISCRDHMAELSCPEVPESHFIQCFVQDLIRKEELGEAVTWPTELAALENVFSKKVYPAGNLPQCDEQSQCFIQVSEQLLRVFGLMVLHDSIKE